MSLTAHVGIVSLTKDVSASDLSRISAAIQKQVTRDFGPLWEVDATVDSFAQLEDLPLDYWPVIIVEDDNRLPASASGIHLDKNKQPFALVRAADGWGMTTSHEVLEMLADPTGNRTVASDAPEQAAGQGRVQFLVEVCDPCEATDYSYTINGLVMSDFYTKHYFDPKPASGVQYSYTGAITKPREVLPGGYLSWQNPTDENWYQLIYPDTGPDIVNLGKLDSQEACLRASIDRIANKRSFEMMFKNTAPVTTAQRKFELRTEPSCKARAEALREQVNALMKGSSASANGSDGHDGRAPRRGSRAKK